MPQELAKIIEEEFALNKKLTAAIASVLSDHAAR